MRGGVGWPTVGTCSTPLNCRLTKGEDGKFYVTVCFATSKTDNTIGGNKTKNPLPTFVIAQSDWACPQTQKHKPLGTHHQLQEPGDVRKWGEKWTEEKGAVRPRKPEFPNHYHWKAWLPGKGSSLALLYQVTRRDWAWKTRKNSFGYSRQKAKSLEGQGIEMVTQYGSALDGKTWWWKLLKFLTER